MIEKKFCLVGVEFDFEDVIIDNYHSYLGFFTSKIKKSYKLKNKKLGTESLKDWKKIKSKFNPDIFITIDDGIERERLYKKVYKKNCKNLLVKNSYISPSSKKYLLKKKSVIIQRFAKIMPNVEIEDGVKINIACQIHHGCKIGKFSTLAPAAVILGNVKIGKHSYIGANSTIKQNIKIGNHCIIGAGSVVIRDIKDYEVVAGNPSKLIRKNIL